MAEVLTVGGVDVTAFIASRSPKVSNRAYRQTGVMTFGLQGATGSAVSDIEVEQEVSWVDGATKLYGGTVRTITPSDKAKDDWLVLSVECQDYSTLLFDDVIDGDGSYAADLSDGDDVRIKDILDTWGTKGITYTAVQELRATMPSADYTGMTVGEAIKDILKLSGGQLYVDYDKDLHTFLTESNAAPFNVSDAPNGSTTFGYRNLTFPTDSVALKNAVYVIPGEGGDAVATWYTDATSIAAYGRREASLKDERVTVQATLDSMGAAFLAEHKNPRRSGSFTCFEPGLLAGMNVQITSVLYGLSAEEFRIVSVDTTYPVDTGPAFHVTFNDAPVTLAEQMSGMSSAIASIPSQAAGAVNSTLADLSVAGANLVVNSGFENASTTGWTVGSEWVFGSAQSDAFDRAYVARIALTAQAAGELVTPAVAVVRTDDYWASAWSYLRAYTSGGVSITLREYSEAAGTTLVASNVFATISAAETDWTRHTLHMGPNDQLGRTAFHASTVSVRLVFTTTGSSTLTWDVDGLQVERGRLITAYAPRPAELVDGSVGTTKIANDAVTTDKIIANAVTAGKIAANTITAAEIAANAITADEIAAGAVTTAKLNTGNITLYGPGGETILDPLTFGPVWWRMIHGWIANGDFVAPPAALSTNIDNSTNPLPKWTFTKASGTAINAQVLADTGNGSGNALRFIMASGAASDSSYIEQVVPVLSSQNRAFSFTPYGHIEWIARSGATVAQFWIRLQFLKKDLTTTGSEYTQTFGDQAATTTHEVGPANPGGGDTWETQPPADAYYARVRWGLQRVGATSATCTVQINETSLIAAQPRLHVPEATTPATYTKGLITQENGILRLTANGLNVDAGDLRGVRLSGILQHGGSAFPTYSLASGDLWFRTDLGGWYYYDGTRWLSAQLFTLIIPAYPAATHPLATTATAHLAAAPHAGVYDLWLDKFALSYYVSGGTALSGSHKWTETLVKNPAGTTIATVTIDGGASNTWLTSVEASIGALLGTSNVELEVASTKTGTPGDLYASMRVSYRIALN